MTYRFRVTPLANDDLIEARDWYDAQSRGLGDDFICAMEAVFKIIEHSPKIFAAGHRGVRATKHSRFPYIVRYQIIQDEIVVIAVTHGRRASSVWRLRL